MGSTKKPTGYWADFSNFERELLAFIEKHGTPGVMPTDKELRKARLGNLPDAISKHGGYAEVAERLGLTYNRKRPGYWDDFSNVKRELLAFIQEQGTHGVMPTQDELMKAPQGTLPSAIQKHGGYAVVAKRLKLELTYTKKTLGYWDDFVNLERELLAFIAKHGTPGLMPTNEELRKAKQSSLSAAIQKHGGYPAVAERLELGFAHIAKPPGYWDDFSNVERKLLEFIQEYGNQGVMPKDNELRQAGQSSLSVAIGKHGGYSAVAERLGLRAANKRRGYWDDFTNVEYELRNFIEEHGIPDVMPTDQELAKAKRKNLAHAIQKHGGCSVVARRLGLTYTEKEYITTRAAADVEKTARAIQPLAESNLLSSAQVMVILRRAGLLEYRNQRVVRLNASLARGKHEEIENAIAHLINTPEELTTEPITIEESEDITASEAEAVISSGLDTSENPPLTQSLSNSTEPDAQREQAVIRGLSALGELRLPLDEVLQLLTSKILWQAFYKRLYAWYGGLDAAQNITNEDVEAAILSAYPEHTDNEFVAEASAKFTEEVKQAVNFAASLPNSGWHGPRLRLHQTDAARRMAEVLSNQEADCPFLLNADDPGMGKSACFLAAVCASGIRRVLLVAPKTVADDTWTACKERGYDSDGEIQRCLPKAKILRGLKEIKEAIAKRCCVSDSEAVATLGASAQIVASTQSSELTFFVLH